MPCDPQSLITDAVCIECGTSKGMEMAIMISLAAQIAGVSTDPASLITNSLCIQCRIPDGMEYAVMIKLACDILNGV